MMQLPSIADCFPAETVNCEQVRDKFVGMLVPASGIRSGTYVDPFEGSSVLVLGDSFSRIYQLPEPRALGTVVGPNVDRDTSRNGNDLKKAKRLLPGSAGFLSHLAHALKAPVDFIVSDGGAATDVRKQLAASAGILEGKAVVVWEFAERDIRLGSEGWQDVPLPVELPGK
jgi:hypothetical protein